MRKIRMRKTGVFLLINIFILSSLLLFLSLYSSENLTLVDNKCKNEDFNEYQSLSTSEERITIFYDDFESGTFQWSGFGENNYWHINDSDFFSPSHCLRCANKSTGMYEKKIAGTSVRVIDSVTIEDLNLMDFSNVTLSFMYQKQTEGGNYDVLELNAHLTGDDFYLNQRYTDNSFYLDTIPDYSVWLYYEIDLSFFCGYDNLDLVFTFDTINAISNDFSGVKVDDVNISGVKNEILYGSGLDIDEEDEFIYSISYVDTSLYNQIFGKDPIGGSDDQIKIKIYDSDSYSTYWGITVRFWEPGDNFDNTGQSEEFTYIVNKNPYNFKNGIDFFIPSNDIYGYLERADNVDIYTTDDKYNIHHGYESEWDEYWIELVYDDFRVDLKYGGDGVLRGMMIHENDAIGQNIFEMWLKSIDDNGEDEGKDEDDNGPENLYVTIPGYDLIVLFSLISVMSLIIGIRFKKIRKR
ncbi:MAG: hypothetical protein ACFFAN_10945 [Promethearchaeota archaeon]